MSAPAPTPVPTPRPTSPPPDKKPDAPAAVTTQGRVDFRKRLPVWVQELPQFGNFRPSEPDPNYQLLSKADLEEVLKGLPEEVKEEIFNDIDFMDYELLRLFRERDHTAKFNQNRYRRQQI